jgi:hypothetical protein
MKKKFALAGEGRSHRAVGVIECQLFSAGNAEAEPSTDEQGTDHLVQPVSCRPNTRSGPDPLRRDLETMNKRLKAAGAGS